MSTSGRVYGARSWPFTDSGAGPIGAEFQHIQNTRIRNWVRHRLESHILDPAAPREAQIALLRSVMEAETFEVFLHTRYVGQKRFSLQGAEGLIAAQRPVLMVELNEDFNPGVVQRLAERYAALNYRGLFLSHGRLHPIAQFDAGVHQDLTLLKYPRHKLPKGREFINNVVFIPEEKSARLLARLQITPPRARARHRACGSPGAEH